MFSSFRSSDLKTETCRITGTKVTSFTAEVSDFRQCIDLPILTDQANFTSAAPTPSGSSLATRPANLRPPTAGSAESGIGRPVSGSFPRGSAPLESVFFLRRLTRGSATAASALLAKSSRRSLASAANATVAAIGNIKTELGKTSQSTCVLSLVKLIIKP